MKILNLEKRAAGVLILTALLALAPVFGTLAVETVEVEGTVTETEEIEATEDEISVVEENYSNYPIAGVTKELADMSRTAISDPDASPNNVSQVAEGDLELEITDTEYIMYVTEVLNIREYPDTDSDVLGKLVAGNEVTITGEVSGSDFVRISYKGNDAFIHSSYLSEDTPREAATIEYTWEGAVLTKSDGTVKGPSGKETYYNLPMSGVIKLMESRGFDYEYWVRSDGVKMYGDYIMLAADTNRYPKGTILEVSLGTGIVCDHCESAANYSGTWIDIAVTW